jgi:pilus assembly protein CpaE
MKMRVLIAGRSAAAVHTLQNACRSANEFEARARVMTNGHTDVLHGLDWDPQIVVLRFDSSHLAEISAWAESGGARPALIVVGPSDNVEAVRLAIRSGAKDFLPEPVRPEDLRASLLRVRQEIAQRAAAKPEGVVSAFVGAAGGTGTSFVATNMAHMLATVGGLQTVLVDLDLNFSPLAHYLDLRPERGLLEALETVESLDAHALAGYGAHHRSGLRLLCAAGGRVALTKDVPADRLAALLDLLALHHRHVIVDAPHALDSLNAMVFGMASSVYVVLQQSVLHLRNAVRLTQILQDELGLPKQRVKFVLNRYSKDATVALDDVRHALDREQLYVVPSHYKTALQSVDSGVPLYDADRAAPVTRGLLQIYSEFSGQKRERRTSFLQRAFPSLLRN